MFTATFRRSAIALAVTGALVAACGGSDDDAEPAAGEPANGAPAADASEDGDAGSGGDGPSADTVGDVLRIDGTEYPGFSGDCEISRDFGGQDVGDVSVEGMSIIVGIDNVDEANPDNENDFNFVMINETAFRVRNQNGDITSVSEISGRTSNGSLDYTTIRFTGTLDDGRSVEADVICELQNQF